MSPKAPSSPRHVDVSDSTFERYMRFEDLVDQARIDVQFLPDGSGVRFADADPALALVHEVDAHTGACRSLPAPPAAKPTHYPDALAEMIDAALGVSAAARFTPRSFAREQCLTGMVQAMEVMLPDRAWLASLKDGNIHLRSTVDGRSMALTTCGTPDDAWDFETGLRKPWSPDGLRLFAIRFDRSAVRQIPQLHPLQRDEQVQWHRFQRAGAALDRAALFIVPVLGKPPVPIDVGDTTDYYVRLLGWSPDGSEVWFARFTRDFASVDLYAADGHSGAARHVLRETSPTFVRLQHNVLWDGDCGFTALPSGAGFLWLSERDGHAHLYHHDRQGRLLQQLTHGALVVHAVTAIDEAVGWVYFKASTEQRPYDQHLVRVALAGGNVTQLTDGEGTHQVKLSPKLDFFVDSFSSVAQPPRTELRRCDGSLIGVLHEADTTRLRSSGWRPAEEFTVMAADGATELWGVMYKPDDFDPTRRYPVIEYIYGGPQIHNLPSTFLGGSEGSGRRVEQFVQALAKTGFITVVIAGRGTPGRSKTFQDAVYRSWSDHVVADHAGAIEQLAARHTWIDAARVGIFGRSWGGYFSFRLLAERPDVYTAAVSIVPGFDPYAGILYEPYLGLPERDRRPFDEASVFRLAPQVRGELLLVGGVRDIATYTDVLRMVNALVEAGVHHELLLLPNQPHYFGTQASDFTDREVLRFFRSKLGGSV